MRRQWGTGTMLKKKSNYQTYQDGWGTSWETVDRRLKRIRQDVIHFEEQTVGERRYWDAFVAGTQINRAVKVPLNSAVKQGDVFIIEGQQYEVVQKDWKDDKLPASWLLSLSAVPIAYREN